MVKSDQAYKTIGEVTQILNLKNNISMTTTNNHESFVN